LTNAIVEKQALDDDRDVGRKTAAALEGAKNRVVVFDETQAHRPAEVVGVRTVESVTPARKRNDAVDRIEVLQQQSFRIHRHAEDFLQTTMQLRLKRDARQYTLQ
jgi:hypothetical protein